MLRSYKLMLDSYEWKTNNAYVSKDRKRRACGHKLRPGASASGRPRQESFPRTPDGWRFRRCYSQSDFRPLPSNTFQYSPVDQQTRETYWFPAPLPSSAALGDVSPQAPAAVCVERRDAALLLHHSPVPELLTIRFREPPGWIFSSGPDGCL